MSIAARARRLCFVKVSALAVCAWPPAVAGRRAPTRLPPMRQPPPRRGVRGLDLAAIDRSVHPGDDFYKFANGTWLATTEIPPDRSTWGPTENMAEVAAERTRALLEAAGTASPAPGTMQQQAADYYASYMDDAGIEAKGLAPLQPMLARIAAIDSHAALSRALGEELRADVDALNNTNFRTDRLLGVWVTAALDDPATSRPYLLQGGLDLPDREYYLENSPRMAGVRKEFAAHVARTLRLAGVADADAAAAAIVALETRMARVHASRAESIDVLKANNPWKREEFPGRAPGIDWGAFLAGARLDTAPVIIVWHPSAVRGLSALVHSEPLASWKHWLTFHAIDRNAAVLPKAFVDERFAFHGKVLNGTPQLAERWKRGIAATSAAIPEAVGQIYVARYFPPETKAQMQAMVKNLITAFGARIDRLEWMSAATKVKARQKLATLRVGVGYPDTWVDYRGLQIVRGDAFGNRQRAERFEYQRHLAKLGKPVDKGEWWMSPQTVNALNLPLQNALNFPAAILAPPYFDPAAPAATNYGAIGAVIGHEITHSFDDIGAMFDAGGRLANWWTRRTAAVPRRGGAAGGAVRRLRAVSRPAPQRPADAQREHRRRRRPCHRARRLAGVAWRHGRARARRLHRSAAVLSRLRPGLADQVAGAGAAPGRHHRRARARRVPRRHGAQPRRVVRRVRREAGPRPVSPPGPARARLVRMNGPSIVAASVRAREPIPITRRAGPCHPTCGEGGGAHPHQRQQRRFGHVIGHRCGSEAHGHPVHRVHARPVAQSKLEAVDRERLVERPEDLVVGVLQRVEIVELHVERRDRQTAGVEQRDRAHVLEPGVRAGELEQHLHVPVAAAGIFVEHDEVGAPETLEREAERIHGHRPTIRGGGAAASDASDHMRRDRRGGGWDGCAGKRGYRECTGHLNQAARPTRGRHCECAADHHDASQA